MKRTSLGPTVAQQDQALARIIDRALNRAHRRSVRKVALGLSMDELNLVREWFNALEDLHPCANKYFERKDRDLMKRITSAIAGKS